MFEGASGVAGSARVTMLAIGSGERIAFRVCAIEFAIMFVFKVFWFVDMKG